MDFGEWILTRGLDVVVDDYCSSYHAQIACSLQAITSGYFRVA